MQQKVFYLYIALLGERTVFVMTKMDVAELHHMNPSRVRSAMEGRLFRMNALGYFAVITGAWDTRRPTGYLSRFSFLCA